MSQRALLLNFAIWTLVGAFQASSWVTQLAFYAGWPNAISAVTVAREVFAGTRR